jgi:hypothetical protein
MVTALLFGNCSASYPTAKGMFIFVSLRGSSTNLVLLFFIHKLENRIWPKIYVKFIVFLAYQFCK